MQRNIEIFAAVQFLVIVLSHMLQPRAWAEFFIILRGKGHAGVFANGFLSLIFGSVIVAFHNVWGGLPTVLTVIGWAQLVKAFIAFVVPRWSLRSMDRIAVERAHVFIVPGAIFVVLGALMGYVVLVQ